MKPNSFFVACLFASVFVESGLLSAEDATNDEELYRSIRYKKYETITRSDIPDGKLPFIIGKLKATSIPKHQSILIRLQDEDTTSNLINKFIRTKGQDRSTFQILSSSQSPWILPDIGENLYLDEPAGKQGLDYGDFSATAQYGISVNTALLMRELLSRSHDVPDKVRNWAETVPSTQTDSLRDSMRQWWTENREAVKSGDYSQLGVPTDNLETTTHQTELEEVPNMNTNSLTKNIKTTDDFQSARSSISKIPFVIVGIILLAVIAVVGFKVLGKSS